jgi:hypothetical protein
MTYHSVCNKSSTIFTTCGAAPADPSGAPKFIPGFSEIRVARSSVFCVMFCRSLFVYPSTITVSDYPFVIFYDYGLWLPLCYLLRLRFLITPLLSSTITVSDYPFVIFYDYGLWLPLCYLLRLRFLITPLLSSTIAVSDYSFVIFYDCGFWLPLCYLLRLRFLITPLLSSTIAVSDYPFVIFYDYGFWLPLCYLLRLQFLITSLVFYGNVLSVRLWLRFLITRLVSYGHCVICPSRITVSEYPFVIFWLPLCYLLITPLVSSNLSYILYLWYIKECQITFWCRFNKLF